MSKLLKEKLDLKEVKQIFIDGIKATTEELKIGFEYERLPILKENNHSAPYEGIDGVCEVLRLYARNENWDYLLDKNNIIGLKKLHNTLTLEPGSQMELSIKPYRSIKKIEQKIKEIDSALLPILNEFDIKLLNYGVSILSTYKNIKLLPKRRYHIMANYLWGILSDVMMRETAGIQAGFDYTSEEDAMRKFRLANMLSPFATAMFANSPIRGGVDTGYKTFRALAWLNTDSERCGLNLNLESFDDYINKILKTPMIMFQREDDVHAINGTMSLEQFMTHEYMGEIANLDDFKLSANLYFPDVRLRKFIEIRNQDCAGKGLQYALLAFYKGILYSEKSMQEVEELFKNYKPQHFSELRYNVPKLATQAPFANTKAKDIIKELLTISENGLKDLNENEEEYLEPIQDLAYQGLCPADIILKNWYSSWNKDINKLIEYVSE